VAGELAVEDWESKLDDWLNQELEPPLFINGIGGVGSPFWIPELESRWIGTGTVEQRMVAVAESMLFLVQRNLEELVPLEPRAVVVRVTGGLSGSDALCQRLADLCCLPVERPVVREATARGTAFWLAGEPEEWPELGPPTVFAPREDARLLERYARWLERMNDTLS
jgi:glycerol kinase